MKTFVYKLRPTLAQACEVAPSPLPPTGKAVGIDVGLESFATLSHETQIANPRYYRAAERKLKQAQRRLSRRVKGSNRRRNARELLAKAHLKVKRARQDFAHKTARTLVNEYDRIAVEKLNIRGMVPFAGTPARIVVVSCTAIIMPHSTS